MRAQRRANCLNPNPMSRAFIGNQPPPASRARRFSAHDIAARSTARRKHRIFIADYAAGLGSAAVNPKEEWHEEILTATARKTIHHGDTERTNLDVKAYLWMTTQIFWMTGKANIRFLCVSVSPW